MKSIRKQLAAGLGAALGLAVVPLQHSDAGTSTASLSVAVTVVSNCKVTASALTFANYVSGQATTNDTSTTLSYSGCPNESLKFELDDGSNLQGSFRGMRSSAGAVLGYQLYRNTTYNSIIGSGTNAVSFTAPASGTGTVTVYGRIPANQSVAAGTYTDTVGVTLTF
jgi:spore coat protein U-like protein